MKKLGWIFLIFGVLGFLGAASKGHSVFGPTFWIALGSFLIYRANKKEQDSKKQPATDVSSPAEVDNTKDDVTESALEQISEASDNTNRKESLEDIQAQLTLQQREAAICLISFFGGFNNNLEDERPMALFRQAASFFGVSNSPAVISGLMLKYTDAEVLIDTVRAIKPIKAKEFLLLTCYDLAKTSNNPEANDVFFNIANDMGYDKNKMKDLIKCY